MISVKAEVTGIDQLNRRLDRLRSKLSHPKELHSRIASYIFGAFQRNMSRGVDPNGNPLAPVARWTRIARHTAYKGVLIPLLASGRLRNAMNIWDLSDRGVMIGWKGEMLDIATRMTKGTPSMMQVRSEKINRLYSGIRTAKKDQHNYMRVNNDGAWITRQVNSSNVFVKPKARKFFYLTKKQVDKSMEIANAFIKESINK